MPYQLQDTGAGFIAEFSGTLTDDDITTANSEIFSHPMWDLRSYQIWDFLTVDAVALSEENIQSTSDKDSRAFEVPPGKVKIALVATAPDMVEFCNLYIESLGTDHITAQVFPDREQAYEWINGRKK